jgi:hypothetical protein
MEKLTNHPLVVRLRSLLHARENPKGMSVYLLWRLTLAASFATAIALTALAWISYDWAVSETELQFSRPNREVFSIDELHQVIGVYQKKEEEHAALRAARPEAPVLGVTTAN